MILVRRAEIEEGKKAQRGEEAKRGNEEARRGDNLEEDVAR